MTVWVDVMVFFFGASALHGFFLMTVLLLARKGNVRAHRWLAVLIGLFSYNVLYYFLYYHGWLAKWPHLIFTNAGMFLLVGPLVYLFTAHALNEKRTFDFRMLIHFLPYALNLVWLLPFLARPASTKLTVLENFTRANNQMPLAFVPTVVFVVTVTHLVVYAFLTLRTFKSFSRNEKANEMVKRRFGRMVNTYLFFTLVAVVYHVAGFLHLPFDSPLCYLLKTLMIVPIYALAYQALLHPTDIHAPAIIQKYKNSPLTTAQANQVAVQVKSYLETHKSYRDSEWSLTKLSEAMELPPGYLSQAINEGCGCSFNDLVNQYRVREAMDRLLSDEHVQVIEVAYQCGFGNKVSFYSAFKKIAGLTPTAFREKNRTERVREAVSG